MESKILVATSKNVRLILADTTNLVKELIKYSEYDEMFLTSAIALVNIASIMSMNIKNENGKILFVLKADGLLGDAKVIARYDGKIMGAVKIDNDLLYKINNAKSLEEFSQLYKIGTGSLMIENDLGLKTPYITTIPIDEKESIEEAIEDYYLNSEQLNTILKTGIVYDEKQKLKRSSCLFIQEMPGADTNVFKEYQKKLKEIYSLNELLEHDFTLEKVANLVFENIEEYKLLDNKDLKLECMCSYEYFKNLVKANLKEEEIKEILEEKGHIETVCGFCNRVYRLMDF
ncbi:Hsp33 family molecular chaperone HslO [Oceanivirga miroungae]|uniref:Hsp33 protein n=1 Tax=Oceanivirga miroungae TaxID=1130046 RepID=A0A6I8MAB6_9FUSO|nr:Hsp33 family molecular chaperone HslO [Oceanivirga miroungae]VWL85770.1 Hsp33 protein [Oceanivirga miroungae]